VEKMDVLGTKFNPPAMVAYELDTLRFEMEDEIEVEELSEYEAD
jgi:hypothetical protein